MDLGFINLALVAGLAVIMEIIDSGLGMMYGTLLSPMLVLMGYNPKLVVPAILISQAAGGATGSIGHHLRKNSDFSGLTKDMKISLAIIIPGIAACILGAYIGQIIPRFYMKLYIGVLVVIMGWLCLRPIYYDFTWKRMWGVGLLSGFNKALSGGGFGPITSTGKILSGVDPKVSVGTTTLAEVPICIVSFITWLILGEKISWAFPAALCIGSLIGGYIGPILTARMDTSKLRAIVGLLAVLSGVWLLVDLFLGLGMGQ
ncbi:MAG: sulfite exporter TauE/SafE family protein [Elusimicrobia bacterium]|nr:sulfite exporter TauE/SafE family protein [Elusimicrobiota bacterium]